jgi:hypothetical protein
MTNQDKPTSQGEQQWRGMLWRILIRGTLLVPIILVGAFLRSFGSPAAVPLPVRTHASPSPAHVYALLETVAGIPLPGGASRFDYQSVDPRRELLFISHLGASTVTVFDLMSGRIRANIANISDVHGMQAIPELGRVYASATDLRSIVVTGVQTVGETPDGLALDSGWHLLYLASETGQLSVFEESRQGLRKLYEGFVATVAHTVAVDEQTHRIFLPLHEVLGGPF